MPKAVKPAAEPGKPGRPRKFEGGAVRTTILLSAEDLAELKSFCRWRAFKDEEDISLGKALVDTWHESPGYKAFRKETA